MKKEEEIAYQIALEKLKKIELENNKLKSENSKISNELINVKALYNSSSISLKEKDKDIKKLKKDICKKDDIIAKKNFIIDKKENTIIQKNNVIAKKQDIISEQLKNIEMVKKYLVDQEIMTQKAVNALFGKTSAKTKNLVLESITKNAELPKKKDKEKQQRGRKKESKILTIGMRTVIKRNRLNVIYLMMKKSVLIAMVN